MRRRKKVGLLASAVLLCSASLAFASPSIYRLSQLSLPLAHPNASDLYIELDPALERMLTDRNRSTNTRFGLEYKAWRTIQASA